MSHSVSNVGATLGLGDLADGSAQVGLVVVAEHLAHGELVPLGDASDGGGALSQLIELAAAFGIGQQRHLLARRQRHRLAPAVEGIEQEPGLEVQPALDGARHGEGDDLAAPGQRVLVGAEVVLHHRHLLGAGGRRDQIPVERPLRRRGHPGDQVDLLRAEPPDRGDELERGAIEAGADLGQCHHLRFAGMARRHRLAVGIVVGGGPAGAEPQAAGVDRFGQHGLH